MPKDKPVVTDIGLTQQEIEALAAKEELKRQMIVKHALDTDVIGQMTANVERMEREGATDNPPLDSKSPDNAGKTQYQIDSDIKISYEGQRENLIIQNPEFFAG